MRLAAISSPVIVGVRSEMRRRAVSAVWLMGQYLVCRSLTARLWQEKKLRIFARRTSPKPKAGDAPLAHRFAVHSRR
jgi:hypothetical protein